RSAAIPAPTRGSSRTRRPRIACGERMTLAPRCMSTQEAARVAKLGQALDCLELPFRELCATRSPMLLQVVDYQKAYRDLIAVEGLNFEVAAGSVLGLIGPNGAGKTTTLRAL